MMVWALPSIIGFEVTPAYNWQMYAKRAIRPEAYPLYILRFNDSLTYNAPHTWADHSRMMLQYTLPHWAAIREGGDTLPFHTKTERLLLPLFRWNARDNHLQMTTEELRRYPEWVQQYLSQQTGEHVENLRLERVWACYDEGNRVRPIAQEILFSR